MSIAFNEADRLSSEKNPGSTGEKWLIAIGACEQCTPLNGEPVSQVGYPPLHPQCGCTTLNDVMSIEAFTDSWLDYMNGGSNPKFDDWMINVYKAA
jgi:hypothetical protein